MAINGIPEGFELVEEEVDTKVNIPEGFELVQDETQEVSVPGGFELLEEKQPPVEEAVKQPEIDIEPLKEKKAKRFDKGIFKMAEREAYDKYKETGEIDLNLIPKEELEEESSKYSKDVSLGVKILNEFVESKINFQNALENIPIQLRNTFDDAQGYSVKFLENFEKGAGDFFSCR